VSGCAFVYHGSRNHEGIHDAMRQSMKARAESLTDGHRGVVPKIGNTLLPHNGTTLYSSQSARSTFSDMSMR
jgi:hypothetical protein